MKTVLKFWLVNKKASANAILAMIAYIAYAFISAQSVIAINVCVSDPEYFNERLMVVIFYYVLMISLSLFARMRRKHALYDIYISNCNKLIDKVVDSDVTMFVKYSCAYIHTIQNAITDLCAAGWGVLEMIQKVASIIIPVYTVYKIAGWLILPVVLVYGIAVVMAKILHPICGRMSRKVASVTKKRNQEMEDAIFGFMEVRSFQTQEYHRNRVYQFNKERNLESVKKAKLISIIDGGFQLVDAIAVILTLIVSSRLISTGTLSVTDGITIVVLIYRIIDPLVSILDFMDTFSQLTQHASDYDAIMNFDNPKPSGNLELSRFDKGIQIKDISFSYEDASNTLEKVSIDIRKGEKIGICGESGGGKSTLFKLLNKLYKPLCGQILIDGTDIWDLTNDSYRKFIRSVHQENTMFPGTIWENIVYGSKWFKEVDVIEACKKAHIYEFIMSLPQKFETEIGPRGLILSTGQKQRIALARVLLTDPEIILLDEATSALDNESEKIIQDAIDSLQGKTIITIAHRLSTIWNSDRIYVIGDHKVLEYGTHEELMSAKGVYYRMNKQKREEVV